MRVPCWVPLRHVVSCAEPVGRNLFRIAPCQYLVALPSNERFEVTPDAPLVTALLWAPTDGAARRVLLFEVEADELADAEPPPELLPAGHSRTYGRILDHVRGTGEGMVIESATYRIARDGAFVQRNILTRQVEFHFRKRHGAHDRCYAITYRLSRPRSDAPAGSP